MKSPRCFAHAPAPCGETIPAMRSNVSSGSVTSPSIDPRVGYSRNTSFDKSVSSSADGSTYSITSRHASDHNPSSGCSPASANNSTDRISRNISLTPCWNCARNSPCDSISFRNACIHGTPKPAGDIPSLVIQCFSSTNPSKRAPRSGAPMKSSSREASARVKWAVCLSDGKNSTTSFPVLGTDAIVMQAGSFFWYRKRYEFYTALTKTKSDPCFLYAGTEARRQRPQFCNWENDQPPLPAKSTAANYTMNAAEIRLKQFVLAGMFRAAAGFGKIRIGTFNQGIPIAVRKLAFHRVVAGLSALIGLERALSAVGVVLEMVCGKR